MEKLHSKILINLLLSVLLVHSQTQEKIPQQWLNQAIETKPHPIHCHRVADDVPVTKENSVKPKPFLYNSQGLQKSIGRVPQNLVVESPLNPVNTPNPVNSGPQHPRSIDSDYPHNTNINLAPNNAVAGVKEEDRSDKEAGTPATHAENDMPVPTSVLCLDASKVVQVKTKPHRRNFDDSPIDLDIEYGEETNRLESPTQELRKCYACSNISNVHCNEPVNGITTIKYCSTLCIKKVVNANGLSVLVRDCGDSCENRYSSDVKSCNVCHKDLCNGALSFESGPTLFNAICSIFILSAVTLF